eukprot:9255167-Pyramimonas_sp.AAC.1
MSARTSPLPRGGKTGDGTGDYNCFFASIDVMEQVESCVRNCAHFAWAPSPCWHSIPQRRKHPRVKPHPQRKQWHSHPQYTPLISS